MHRLFFSQPSYNPDLVPCDLWLFPKINSPLKARRFVNVMVTRYTSTVDGVSLPTATFERYVKQIFVMCRVNVIVLAVLGISKDRNVLPVGVKRFNTKDLCFLDTWHTAHTAAQLHIIADLHLHKGGNYVNFWEMWRVGMRCGELGGGVESWDEVWRDGMRCGALG
jgi:hypothetical protein